MYIFITLGLLLGFSFIMMTFQYFAKTKSVEAKSTELTIIILVPTILIIMSMFFTISGSSAEDLKIEFTYLSTAYSENMMWDEDSTRFVMWFPDTEDQFTITAVESVRLRLDIYNAKYERKVELRANKWFGKNIRLFEPCRRIEAIENPVDISWIDDG